MTRINCAIAPQELTREHLLAEHREIKRIPNAIINGRFNLKGIPTLFTLGTGHVKFFYDKLEYLHKRYISIYMECISRGYNVTDYSNTFENAKTLYPSLYNDYIETNSDRELLLERINDRLSKKT